MQLTLALLLALSLASCAAVDRTVAPIISTPAPTQQGTIAHKWHTGEITAPAGEEGGAPVSAVTVPESWNLLIDLGEEALPFEVSEADYRRLMVGDGVSVRVGTKRVITELHK